MRITQLVVNLEIGGLERLAIDLARQQQLSHHDPRIYCLFQAGPLADEAASLGIPVVTFDKPKGLSLRTIRRIARQLRQDRTQVLHTHNAVVHHYGVLAAKLARVPVIVNTQHGTGTLTADPKLARIFRRLLPWTDLVAMVSEGVRSNMVEHRGVPLRKTRVILNGVPLAKFENCQAAPGSRRPLIRFGAVGRLVAAKDHRTLLEAFSRVLTELPEAELHIAGDGPLRPDIEALIASLRLSNPVSLHGAVSDIGPFLSTLDVFVLSSVTEGLPISLLEAMAAGLPVVTTRVNGVIDTASPDFAEFCDPGQPEQLAQAMLRMARKPDLASIGDTARKAARAYGVEQTASHYEHIFEKLLAGEILPAAVAKPALHTR
jgi:glycosyltransferase involved in cell wall biosynthesis